MNTTEREIVDLAHEWIEAVARRDRAALERILAADFLIAGWLPDGRLGDRELYIEDCLTPVAAEQPSYRFDRWKVRCYGETAIVNCVFECHVLVNGEPWGGQFLFTDVWVRQDGRWRAATRHSSALSTRDS
jgi:hypothetical protein